uniref:CRIB domain-containing protein n=1 Tax=Oryza nivara TaxID=4536 RepID=A0A0E0FWC8_ORYNI
MFSPLSLSLSLSYAARKRKSHHDSRIARSILSSCAAGSLAVSAARSGSCGLELVSELCNKHSTSSKASELSGKKKWVIFLSEKRGRTDAGAARSWLSRGAPRTDRPPISWCPPPRSVIHQRRNATHHDATMASHAVTDALLLPRSEGAVAGAVDFRGRPASRASTGRWSAAMFVLGVEIAERFAYHGVSANLISYLTGPLGESTAGAAAAINLWSGVATMLPLLVACVADAWLGRYRTIVLASLLFVVSMGMLTLSSALPAFHGDGGGCSYTSKSLSCAPSTAQVAIFYVSLYLVALAEAGHKPCAQAFGADQFDQNDAKESVSRSSFFNWWYFGMCSGTAMTTMVSSYIQDNIGWGLGFGIPCLVMAFALAMFLLGTRNYRYYVSTQSSPFARLARAFVALIRGSKDDALAVVDDDDGGDHREELRGVLRLFPIWATCIIYAVIFSQSSTFFTKQAATLDRRIGESFRVPPAALQTFISVTIIAFIPVYDRAFVPVARRFTRASSGITMLQRIGTGLVLALAAMVVAALVEARRLGVARDAGMVDDPKAALPMSLWWMVPQYVLFGLSDVFAMIGLQEFFYDQVPDALRSLGLAFFLSIFGVGHFFSSFIISAIDGATKKSGASWFANNLNRAHLDYFYWLLAGLCAVELVAFVFVSRVYVYKKRVPHNDHRSKLVSHLLDSGMADTVAGAVDYRGRPASRAATGGWKSSVFVMAAVFAERVGFNGVQGNLIMYLTGQLGMSTAAAAAGVNAWGGTAFMLPLLGALAADSWIGRHRAVVASGVLYLLSLGMLTVSPMVAPPQATMVCQDTAAVCSSPAAAPAGRVAFCYVALYLLALGQGFHRPCVQAMDADQFSESNPGGLASRSSFFNWINFAVSCGYVLSTAGISYVQDNVSWGIGFGACWAMMLVSLFVFLLGTGTYRPEQPRTFAETRRGDAMDDTASSLANDFGEAANAIAIDMFYRRSLPTPPRGHGDDKGIVARLLPIWMTTVMYAVVATLFTKQGSTMDRRIVIGTGGGGGVLLVPPAALQSLVSFAVMVTIPAYDRALVPLARRVTKHPSGITTLRRVGTGMVTACLAMAVAALVEAARLRAARDAGLLDEPGVAVPMSVWWLAPQFVLLGVATTFTMVGLEEFFYDQVPDELRSVGVAACMSVVGVGSYASGMLVSAIDWATRSRGESWFSDNLNRAHLDYFYWLLAGISALDVLVFLYFAKGIQAFVHIKALERECHSVTVLAMESGLLAHSDEPCDAGSKPDADADGRRGGWRAARFLIAVGFLERVGFNGVQSNLVMYLAGPMGMSTAAAAAGANAWAGTVLVLTLVGALAADSRLGRYRAIVAAGVLHLLSLGMLTISSVTRATHPHPVSCHDAATACSPPAEAAAAPPSTARLAFFHAALYLLALAQGFHNPCSEAFGADQFAPPSDPGARASRSSYFNWYHFFNSCGYAISNSALSYVEDSVSWTLGFAACLVMTAVYLPVFLLGTGTYRAEQPVHGGGSTLARLAESSSLAARAWTARAFGRKDAICTERLLAKEEVEHGKGLFVKLLPIWLTSIVFAAVVSQQSTLFTKQGSTMDRRVGGIVVPAAALNCVVSFTMITLVPVYDRAVVPLARRFTGHPAGVTTLQRVGAGMATSCLAMVVAALVEARRLRAASDASLVDRPGATVPMGVWWLVPQYLLVGLAKVFGDIGLDEFFYDQAPDGLRSVGLAVSLSVLGVGNYVSGVLVSVIDTATRSGGESWFSDDLNRAHLDYFYWILAAFAALEVVVFVYIAKRYIYKNKGEP